MWTARKTMGLSAPNFSFLENSNNSFLDLKYFKNNILSNVGVCSLQVFMSRVNTCRLIYYVLHLIGFYSKQNLCHSLWCKKIILLGFHLHQISDYSLNFTNCIIKYNFKKSIEVNRHMNYCKFKNQNMA